VQCFIRKGRPASREDKISERKVGRPASVCRSQHSRQKAWEDLHNDRTKRSRTFRLAAMLAIIAAGSSLTPDQRGATNASQPTGHQTASYDRIVRMVTWSLGATKALHLRWLPGPIASLRPDRMLRSAVSGQAKTAPRGCTLLVRSLAERSTACVLSLGTLHPTHPER
jgi:hypothetical protein